VLSELRQIALEQLAIASIDEFKAGQGHIQALDEVINFLKEETE